MPPQAQPPPKVPPSDEDSVYTLVSREESRVLQWRFDELIRMGVTGEDAASIVGVRDVAHTLAAMLQAGCPLKVAVRILA